MQGLAELLSLLYRAHRDINTMTLSTRDIIPLPASNVLVAHPDAVDGRRLRWVGGGPGGAPAVQSRKIWFQPPDQIRVEVAQGREVVRAAARDGSGWWRWDRRTGETAGDLQNETELPPLLEVPLLKPERLLESMIFEITGMGHRTSREGIQATSTLREPSSGSPSQRFEYEFDREHGTPLYIARTIDGETPQITEVTEVRYDAIIEPEIFAFSKRDDYALSPNGRSRRRREKPSPVTKTNPELSRIATVWLTGLSGAGKTTIAKSTERLLRQLNVACCVLDGDELRQGLSSDLGLGCLDRREQAL